ncbi:MAG TPA: NAD(P)H-dependent oxidoreductase subunit E, partial [Rhodanobacteraceae bacterium]|nr:NAD(P)H-dependent oxidoreductase subunit E [Rhodanobacteraceae bacterium]
ECLAACCGAPMMAVNGHYHEKLTPEKVDEILDKLK